MKIKFKHLALVALGSASLSWSDIPSLIEESPSPSFSWSFSDHNIFTNAKDPGDPSLPATNTLAHQTTLGGEYGPVSASVAFSTKLSPNGAPELNRNFIVDKKTLTGDWENWELKLGDTHQELGRGIALSLFSNPAFGVDNTLEGGAVKYRNSYLEMATFGGRVNVLKAPVAINPVDTLMEGRQVVIAGGSITGNLSSDVKLTAHYHTTSNQPEGKAVNKRYQTVGASLDFRNIISGLDGYLESNVMDWEASSYGKGMQQKPRAYGNFASLSYSDLLLKTKIEAKDYRSFVYDFQRPPTLEEEIVLATNNSDVTAARFSAERRFAEGAVAIGATYLTGEDREAKANIHHPVAYSKLKLGSGVEFEIKGGYRWMPLKNNLAHGSLKTKVKTGKGQYLELELRKQNLNQAISSPLPIQEERNAAHATYTFSEKFSLGVGYEFMPTNLAELGNHFVNGTATYKTGVLTARGFIGQTSGGTQCASGVCRQVPPYTGAYLETAVAF